MTYFKIHFNVERFVSQMINSSGDILYNYSEQSLAALKLNFFTKYLIYIYGTIIVSISKANKRISYLSKKPFSN